MDIISRKSWWKRKRSIEPERWQSGLFWLCSLPARRWELRNLLGKPIQPPSEPLSSSHGLVPSAWLFAIQSTVYACCWTARGRQAFGKSGGRICLCLCWITGQWSLYEHDIHVQIFSKCLLIFFDLTKTFFISCRASQDVYGSSGITWKKVISKNGFFSLVALGTNYSYVRALGIETSLPSDITAMFASNCVFVFLLSSIVLGTNFISLKVILKSV